MLLLNFGDIRQYLSDVGDTVRIAVTYRNVDIGLVMFFKLTSVIPAFPVSDIAPVQSPFRFELVYLIESASRGEA